MKHRWLLGWSLFFFVIWLVLFLSVTVPEIGKYQKTVCQVKDIFYNKSVVYPCDCEKSCINTECGNKESCFVKWDSPRRWDQTQGRCCDGYHCVVYDHKDHRCTYPINNRLCEITCPGTCYDYNVTWTYQVAKHTYHQGYETVVPEQMIFSALRKDYSLNETKTCYFQKSSPQKVVFKMNNKWKWALPFTFFALSMATFIFWMIVNFY